MHGPSDRCLLRASAASHVSSITAAGIHPAVMASKHPASSMIVVITSAVRQMVFMECDRQNGRRPFRRGQVMAMGTRQDPDITAVPRAVMIMGVRLLGQIQRALGDNATDIARHNARQAVEADRARAAARAELRHRLDRING